MKLSPGHKDTLIGQASRALGWSFLSNAGARIGTLAIGVLLARLLGPHAFGTFAVALVAMLAVLSFNELGVSLAIVRWQGDPAEIAPTVTTLSLLSSTIIYIGCFFGAPAFSSAMGAPAATNVIRVLALNVIVDGVVATPAALLQRYFRQDRKMIADQVNNWLGAAISIALAASGFGALSLAIGRMAGAVAAGVLFIAFSPLPFRLGFDRAKARALLRFGMPLAGASIIVFAVTNVDQLVVGHVLGATALGFYVLAFNLASWPVNIFSQPVRSVAPAVFSRLQHDPAAMRAGFLSTTGALGSVTLPVCLLISGAALPLIGFLYGPRWLPAAHALLWLGMLGALRILFELVYDYFVVLARSRVIFTIQLVWLLALIPALIVGVRAAGIFGAGMAEVVVAACVVFPWYLGELSKVGIRRRSVVGKLWMPLLGAGGVGLFAIAVQRWISYDLTALLVSGAVALGTIVLLLYKIRPELATLRSMSGGLTESGGSTSDEQAASVEPATQTGAQGLGASGIGRPEVESSILDMTIPIPAIRERVSRQHRFEDAMAAAGSVRLPIYQDSTGPLPIYRDMTGMPPPPAYPLYQDSTQPLPAYRDIIGMSTSSRYHPTGPARRHLAIGRHRRPEWIVERSGDAQAGYLQKEHGSPDAADPPHEYRSLARGQRGSGYDR
jgi:PST family polysaccharide transporter